MKGHKIGDRRPLKSRQTGWAAGAARIVLATGLSANAVSFIGIIFAALGAWAALAARDQPLVFLAAAACIQLRLLANMLDGLVAVEGARGSPTGALWNEVPDRVQDSLLLVAFGYAALPALGWLAALLAAVCAYVRLLGGTLGQTQDFGGPMAKPHRMAALTATALLAALVPGKAATIIAIGLGVIALGTALTIALRLRRIAARLKAAR